uniref:Uncharacterized protein n=1 Tax=Arundo donax TaxID=35708 RepID=A0A0A9DDJ7_ARUDO
MNNICRYKCYDHPCLFSLAYLKTLSLEKCIQNTVAKTHPL